MHKRHIGVRFDYGVFPLIIKMSLISVSMHILSGLLGMS